jgi:hypothetical protein
MTRIQEILLFATGLLCALHGNDTVSAAVFLQLGLSQGFRRVRLRELVRLPAGN